MNLTQIIKPEYLVILVLIFGLISCKNDKEIKSETRGSSRKEIKEEYFLDFYFPDTVQVNKTYEGEIIFKSPLDTITKELLVEGDTMRIIALYLKDNHTLLDDDFEHILASKEVDTFVPNNSKSLKFIFKFNELGNQYLEGVLQDEVYFTTNDTTGLRIITRNSHINLPILVTDNKELIDSYFKKGKPKLPLRI
jgi:hypothetical protein